MNHQKIDYASTNSFSKTVIDYINQEEALRPFYNYNTNKNEIELIIEHIQSANKLDRSVLAETIKTQYSNYIPNLNVVKNIELLSDENTFTITTAHQLNLFTGPLYYIFKILNTVKVTQDLKALYPKYNFIPCYWMGSEDHDFEEVNHTYLFGKKIEWDNFQGGSMGEYSTEGIEPLIEEIKTRIRKGPFLQDLIATFKRAYSQENLAKAVREMLDELFGQFGVVVIDGNCAALKKPMTEIFKDELENQTSSALVLEQIELLDKAGYKSQAHPRDINLFYKTKNVRERIVANDSGFELADSNQKFSKEELYEILTNHPERFSPNVILRPLHQQLVLPNLAYIGGGSEVAYWMQLKTLHQNYNVHFPMLLLRTSAQIISESQQKKLEKLGIKLTDIFKDVDTLKKEFVANKTDLDLELSLEHKVINELFTHLSEKAESIDPSLKNWVGAEGQKTLKSLDNISKRLIKTEKVKNDQSMGQIEKIKDLLFPAGSLQERKENFSPFYAKYGNEFFNQLLKHLDPFEENFKIISEE